MFDDDFSENEIPTVLEQNWNRNDNQHIFFSHRYNVGFSRKVKMTESEIQARKFAIESKKENEERENNGAKDGRLSQGRSNDDKTFGRPENSTIAGDEPYEEKKATRRLTESPWTGRRQPTVWQLWRLRGSRRSNG